MLSGAAKGAVLLLALILGACGSRTDELSRTVWGGDDTPPADVRHQLFVHRDEVVVVGVADAVNDGEAVCADESSPVREIRMDRRPSYVSQEVPGADEPELGETIQICPQRFNLATRAVTLTLRRSDGSEVSQRVAPNDEALASDIVGVVAFFLDRSWPLGQVVVTARQGAIVEQTAFRIVAPRHRGARVQQWLGRPRLPNPLTIMVVGQQPRSSVAVDLYRARGSRFVYATSFHTSTDARGVGQVRVPYARADNGEYLLRPRNAGASEGRDVEARVSICVGCCQSEPQQNAYCLN